MSTRSHQIDDLTKRLQVVPWEKRSRVEVARDIINEAEQRARIECLGKDITDGLQADLFWDGANSEDAGGTIPDVVGEYNQFEVVEIQTGFCGPNIYGYRDGKSVYAFATEKECINAMEAAKLSISAPAPVVPLSRIQRHMSFMGWRGDPATGFSHKFDAEGNVIAVAHDAVWKQDCEEAEQFEQRMIERERERGLK